MDLTNIPHEPFNGLYFTASNRAGNTFGGNQVAIGDPIDQIANFDGSRTSDAIHAGANVQLTKFAGSDVPFWLFDGSGGFDFNATGAEFEAANLPDVQTWYVGFVPTVESNDNQALLGFNVAGDDNRNYGVGFTPRQKQSNAGSRVITYVATAVAGARHFPSELFDVCRVNTVSMMEIRHDRLNNTTEFRFGESEPILLNDATTGWVAGFLFDTFSIGNSNSVGQTLSRAATGAAIAYAGVFGDLTDGQRAEMRSFFSEQMNVPITLIAGDSRARSVSGRLAFEEIASRTALVGSTTIIAVAGDTIAQQQAAWDSYSGNGHRPTDVTVLLGINDFQVVDSDEEASTLTRAMIDYLTSIAVTGANIYLASELFFFDSPNWSPERQRWHFQFIKRIHAWCRAQPRAMVVDIRTPMGDWDNPLNFDPFFGNDALHPETIATEEITFAAFAKAILGDDSKWNWQNEPILREWVERENGLLDTRSMHSPAEVSNKIAFDIEDENPLWVDAVEILASATADMTNTSMAGGGFTEAFDVLSSAVLEEAIVSVTFPEGSFGEALQNMFKDGDIQNAQEVDANGDPIEGSFVSAIVTKG